MLQSVSFSRRQACAYVSAAIIAVFGASFANTPLFDAAQAGSYGDVSALLRTGTADLNARDERGRTVLMIAAGWNSLEVVRALLESGASVHARDRTGGTALMHAATRNEDPAVIQALVEAGADVGARNDNGTTALMLATSLNKNPEVARVLQQSAGGSQPSASSSAAPPVSASIPRASTAARLFDSSSGRPVPQVGEHIRATPAYVVSFVANELELRTRECPPAPIDPLVCGLTADALWMVTSIVDAVFEAYLQPSNHEVRWHREPSSGATIGAFRRPEGVYVISIAGSVVSVGFAGP